MLGCFGMSKRILIVGLNWIGDAIMSMPAIQACRAENPSASITMLCKPYLKPLWEMHADIDQILTLGGVGETVAKIKGGTFDEALILPNSFRSAFLPTMAGIPQRIGLRGEWRALMLTQLIPLAGGHQSNEYFPILAPQGADLVREFPHLNVPDASFPELASYVVLMPGAARGASKMWPLDHFEELALRILNATDYQVVFSGGPSDAEACEALATKLGVVNLAGKTNLKEWAALLKGARVAVANDSGGMHLAAAVGTPVVGIYGITDPEKTGPLAQAYRVIQNSDLKHRDISRNSEAAAQALASITPDQVLAAAQELLG